MSSIMDWNDKKVVIVGAARQGTSLARYLAKHGAEVVITDQRSEAALINIQKPLSHFSIRWVLGGHPLSLLENTDVLCISGGVPLDIPLITAALEAGIPLSNDSQIFMEAVPCPVIGITGSAGKTTTTTLVGRIAKAGWRDRLAALPEKPGEVWIGGNIGNPLIQVVDEMAPEDLAVVELSSFQLELMKVSPPVAGLLNLTPNHLDRHGSMDKYRNAKAKILEFQREEDIAVIGHEEPTAWALRDRVQGKLLTFGIEALPDEVDGVYVMDGEIILREGVMETTVMPVDTIKLRGAHNLQNALAAAALSIGAGLTINAIQEGVEGFMGVPHRLEFVRELDGVSWYNDSIATAPERAIAALLSFDDSIVLLAGGRDKALPWEEFIDLICRRVDHLVAFGEIGEMIVQMVQDSSESQRPLTIERCSGLEEAVHVAAAVANNGDVVLLSPGGTSFDAFVDFAERGDRYKQWVLQLR